MGTSNQTCDILTAVAPCGPLKSSLVGQGTRRKRSPRNHDLHRRPVGLRLRVLNQGVGFCFLGVQILWAQASAFMLCLPSLTSELSRLLRPGIQREMSAALHTLEGVCCRVLSRQLHQCARERPHYRDGNVREEGGRLLDAPTDNLILRERRERRCGREDRTLRRRRSMLILPEFNNAARQPLHIETWRVYSPTTRSNQSPVSGRFVF